MNHILIVDDSLVDRTLAGELLKSQTKYHVEFSSNGVEALEHLEAKLPVAVVTDLKMPEMDGMELIRIIRRRFATVPVVVMTGYGSEDIALQALMLGAADYVPKSQMASELAESIEEVLAVAAADRPHHRLSHCLRYQELHYELDNDILLIPPLVEQLQNAATDMALTDETDRVRLGKALVEAITNAIYHGNLELTSEQIEAAAKPQSAASNVVSQRRESLPFRDRRVLINAVISPEEARFAVRDGGNGFDVSQLPDIAAHPSRLNFDEGRGLVLIRMFMDEVHFNDVGNEITMVKRKPASR